MNGRDRTATRVPSSKFQVPGDVSRRLPAGNGHCKTADVEIAHALAQAHPASSDAAPAGVRSPLDRPTHASSYRGGKPASTPAPIRRMLPAVWPLVALGTFIGLWALIAENQPSSILPGPAAVWSAFLDSWQEGLFLPALRITVEEAVLGWLIGAACALPLGYVIGRWRALEGALAPYLAASQAMPLVAIAPLLIFWLGFGLTPKVVIAALIAFFPLATTTAAGMRGVERDLRDVARVFGANWRQMLIYLELPRAARSIFAGAKISAALSITGAVVGEFVSNDQGLGFLILFGQTNFNTPLMFVAVLTLMILGAFAYASVSILERIVLRWTD